MKDIFDEEGNLNYINYFYITQKKNNIVFEYSMLRTCFKNIYNRFDCSYAKYINVQHNARFICKDGHSRNIECLNCK